MGVSKASELGDMVIAGDAGISTARDGERGMTEARRLKKERNPLAGEALSVEVLLSVIEEEEAGSPVRRSRVEDEAGAAGPDWLLCVEWTLPVEVAPPPFPAKALLRLRLTHLSSGELKRSVTRENCDKTTKHVLNSLPGSIITSIPML